jgi:DNA-binding transcriptional MerR regulator
VNALVSISVVAEKLGVTTACVRYWATKGALDETAVPLPRTMKGV